MKLKVTDQDGNKHELEGLEGWRAMEVIRDYGLPIKAECGGCLACATCHVFVAPEWAARLPAPSPEEQDMLADLPDSSEYSRLSCQIIMNDDLDGLELTLSESARP
ncbi:MAG: 2Fe-2S iron-sulfur cluster binding domain-containing protein [Rhodospirillales bacterium]|nr:2Fe-2S iron-sulfur cluster binding domain-containing protein [Alphaproteobacteria bacterium]MCB9986922.1 2Fe-2S iron-sulfur cluster binding domain-containing protein [Rhodospirillales bacterium]USO08302.1 MAG: 2Fe-2S iron-sulfur cluster binding domain-containing protein [Rhodospirillales bacterium]